MKSKDQTLLEEAYQTVREGMLDKLNPFKKKEVAPVAQTTAPVAETPQQPKSNTDIVKSAVRSLNSWLEKNASQQVNVTEGDREDPPYMQFGYYYSSKDGKSKTNLRITSNGSLTIVSDGSKEEFFDVTKLGHEAIINKFIQALEKSYGVKVPAQFEHNPEEFNKMKAAIPDMSKTPTKQYQMK